MKIGVFTFLEERVWAASFFLVQKVICADN
jgi:hypothetical protein